MNALASFAMRHTKMAMIRLLSCFAYLLRDLGESSTAKGEDMAQHIDTCAKPDPAQPIISIAEIDEALLHTSLNSRRDEHWHRWTDGLLDERNRIQAEAKKTTQP